MIFEPGQHIYFVGIGGFGLSAIARVLLERGYRVSGSDRTMNPLTASLVRDGATIYSGHDGTNINGTDMLIVSSAVPEANPEVIAARAAGIPVYKRVDILGALMAEQHVIAVAGTHGKTTTTAMITHLLQQTGKAPGYIVGGVMANTGTNAASGAGDYFVIEADEYDNAFLGIYPDVAIVNNIEYDHPDFFADEAALMNSFRQFVSRITRDHGVLLACGDDAGAAALASEHRRNKRLAFTYGLNDGAVLRARDVQTHADGVTSFDVFQGATYHGQAELQLPGQHNVLNALAAIYAASTGTDQPISAVIPHLATFQGTGRRFEIRSDIGGIAIVDDYAHHPTAIQTTIAAAQSRFPQRELWVIWQPHTYSRTKALWAQYTHAFTAADHVLITDIYAAREAPLDGISSEAIAADFEHPDAHASGSVMETATRLIAEVQSNAVILILSAGDAPLIGVEFLRARGIYPPL
jgi:UDP-N-acetylmuramate--alanine ligase